ncbi:MAG: aspartate aminotransferase family protein [Nocardioidaceae bacterium]
MDRYARSRAQQQRAGRSLARGVATAFRAAQQPVPITFAGGRGPLLSDIDGNEYVDYALGYGPLLLGHSPEPVLAAVRRQLATGLGYGACHEVEAELAEAVCRTVPCAELCVFSSTGSEAVHAALRISRAATGRKRVVKFLGHFHGWLDPLAIGVPGLHDAAPATGGQDPLASASVTVCPWNDLDALARVLDDDVAAVIMEPVAVNGGCLQPAPGYLEAVRELTRRRGTLLVFDEVITGYRLALGGAQERYGVVPDLAVLGKALGAGFPISAVCGSAEVMGEVVSGRVAHVGTFNMNPVCASAALAAVRELERRRGEIYPQLEETGAAFASLLREEAVAHELPLAVNQLGAAAYAFWSGKPVETYGDTLHADSQRYRDFAAALLAEGVHVIPRGLLYVSTTHGAAELERTREAVRRASAAVAQAVLT